MFMTCQKSCCNLSIFRRGLQRFAIVTVKIVLSNQQSKFFDWLYEQVVCRRKDPESPRLPVEFKQFEKLTRGSEPGPTLQP